MVDSTLGMSNRATVAGHTVGIQPPPLMQIALLVGAEDCLGRFVRGRVEVGGLKPGDGPTYLVRGNTAAGAIMVRHVCTANPHLVKSSHFWSLRDGGISNCTLTNSLEPAGRHKGKKNVSENGPSKGVASEVAAGKLHGG